MSVFKRLSGFFSGPTPEELAAAKTKVQALINENGVVVFSKSYCPYCASTKRTLNKLGAKYVLLELNEIGKSLSGNKSY
jgi:glutaredoxin 3